MYIPQHTHISVLDVSKAELASHSLCTRGYDSQHPQELKSKVSKISYGPDHPSNATTTPQHNANVNSFPPHPPPNHHRIPTDKRRKTPTQITTGIQLHRFPSH